MGSIFSGKKPKNKKVKKGCLVKRRHLIDEASPHRYLCEEAMPLRRGESPIQPDLVGLGLLIDFGLVLRILDPV